MSWKNRIRFWSFCLCRNLCKIWIGLSIVFLFYSCQSVSWCQFFWTASITDVSRGIILFLLSFPIGAGHKRNLADLSFFIRFIQANKSTLIFETPQGNPSCGIDVQIFCPISIGKKTLLEGGRFNHLGATKLNIWLGLMVRVKSTFIEGVLWWMLPT